MSSVNEKTRQQMRETHGLVDSLVGYITSSLDENKAEDKVRQDEIETSVSVQPKACVFICLCVHL